MPRAGPRRPAGPVGLGKLSQQTGKREQARDHLTTATTMYREMDMRFWLEQAEAEMGGLASLMSCCRRISAIGIPVSPCFKMPTISL